jgi:hypothetical protein
MTAAAGGRHRPGGLLLGEGRDQVWIADDVTRAQPGDPPRLGERAEDENARQVGTDEALPLAADRVGEGLVDNQDATRRAQSLQGGARVQDAGRVRGVADEDEVGPWVDGGRIEE